MDEIYIALAVKDNRQLYTLIFRNKRLESYPTAAEAIAARVKLEKQIKEEAK